METRTKEQVKEQVEQLLSWSKGVIITVDDSFASNWIEVTVTAQRRGAGKNFLCSLIVPELVSAGYMHKGTAYHKGTGLYHSFSIQTEVTE